MKKVIRIIFAVIFLPVSLFFAPIFWLGYWVHGKNTAKEAWKATMKDWIWSVN